MVKAAKRQVPDDALAGGFADKVERGRAQLDAGESVSGEVVAAWVESWGSKAELARPQPKRAR